MEKDRSRTVVSAGEGNALISPADNLHLFVSSGWEKNEFVLLKILGKGKTGTTKRSLPARAGGWDFDSSRLSGRRDMPALITPASKRNWIQLALLPPGKKSLPLSAARKSWGTARLERDKGAELPSLAEGRGGFALKEGRFAGWPNVDQKSRPPGPGGSSGPQVP